MYDATAGAPKRWTREEIKEIDKVRHDWLMSNRDGKSPHWEEVQVGDKLINPK